MDDPFALLGLPRRYRLDPGDLRRAYLARSAAAHPDLKKDDPAVQEAAAALNGAKQILEDPERRAGALLELMGGASKEKDRSLPEGFLAEMMQIREQIEGDERKTREWEGWAEERRARHMENVAALFDAAASGGASAETLRRVRQELNAWRYIERLIEQLDPHTGGGF